MAPRILEPGFSEKSNSAREDLAFRERKRRLRHLEVRHARYPRALPIRERLPRFLVDTDTGRRSGDHSANEETGTMNWDWSWVQPAVGALVLAGGVFFLRRWFNRSGTTVVELGDREPPQFVTRGSMSSDGRSIDQTRGADPGVPRNGDTGDLVVRGLVEVGPDQESQVTVGSPSWLEGVL